MWLASKGARARDLSRSLHSSQRGRGLSHLPMRRKSSVRVLALLFCAEPRWLSAAPRPRLPAEARAARLRFRGRDVKVLHGENLRSAMLRNGLTPHNGNSKLINCRGLGTCGTCAVKIDPSSTAGLLPAERNAVETTRLNLPPHRPPMNRRLRLACQCTVHCDPSVAAPFLSVVKHDGFWGSEPALSPEPSTVFRTYFGPLETLFDRAAVKPPPPCRECDDTELVPCPNCDGRGTYPCDYRVPDTDRHPANHGSGGTATMQVQCKACHGSGMVVCRACFRGDPWDVDSVRVRLQRRPD